MPMSLKHPSIVNKEQFIFLSGTTVQSDDLNSDKLTNNMVGNFNVFSPTMEGEIVH